MPVSFCHLFYHSSFHCYLNWFCCSRIAFFFHAWCLKIAYFFSIKCTSVLVIHARLILLFCLRTIRSCEQQGKPPWIIGPARQDVLGKPLSTSILQRSQGGKGFFVLSVISSGKRTALPVRAPACTHTVTSAPACVSLRMCVSKCGAHTCLSAQRKWLTEKNVANSNFNCQWGRKGRGGRGWWGTQYLWALSRWTEERRFRHESVFLITIKKCFNMTATFWS